MPSECTLSSSEMLERMMTELENQPQKEFRVFKSHLNHKTLKQVLEKRPKILVLNCHSSYDYKNSKTTLWFENAE